MKQRYCPACNAKLYASNHFFCTSCGQKLPEALVARPKVTPTSGQVPGVWQQSTPVTKRLTVVSKDKLVAGLFMLIGIASFMLSFKGTPVLLNKLPLAGKTAKPLSQGAVTATDASKEQRVLETDVDTVSLKLVEKHVSFIPSDADIYIEAGDVSWLFLNDLYFDSESEELIRKHCLGDFSAFAILSDAGQREWGVVISLVDPSEEEIAIVFETLGKDYWYYELVENTLAVATNKEVLDLMLAAHSGVIKDITKNPKYAMARPQLYDVGKILVIFTSFEGRKALESLIGYESENTLRAIINNVLNFGYNELIIR